MFKFKKTQTTIFLYCAIAIFIFFLIYKMFHYSYYEYNLKNTASNNIEAFSMKQFFRKKKRNMKQFNDNYVKKYTSKVRKLFKSIF